MMTWKVRNTSKRWHSKSQLKIIFERQKQQETTQQKWQQSKEHLQRRCRVKNTSASNNKTSSVLSLSFNTSHPDTYYASLFPIKCPPNKRKMLRQIKDNSCRQKHLKRNGMPETVVKLPSFHGREREKKKNKEMQQRG